MQINQSNGAFYYDLTVYDISIKYNIHDRQACKGVMKFSFMH